MMRFCAWLLITLGSMNCCMADVYKWNDAESVNYGDTPPPKNRSVAKLKQTLNVVETDKEPYEIRVAVEKNPLTLYIFKECGGPCDQAKAFLDKRGAPYTLKSKDEDKLELQKLTGRLQVPFLMVGKSPQLGFEEATWNAALDQAGYPRSNPMADFKKPAKAAKATADKPPATEAKSP
jgi:glutaredoxin